MFWLPVALLSFAVLVQADLYGTCGGIGTLGGDGLVPGLIPLLTGTLTTLLGTTLAGNQCRVSTACDLADSRTCARPRATSL
jgi:hypothetical protein